MKTAPEEKIEVVVKVEVMEQEEASVVAVVVKGEGVWDEVVVKAEGMEQEEASVVAVVVRGDVGSNLSQVSF